MSEGTGFWLDPAGDEYDNVIHSLRLCLNEKLCAKNIEVWKIDNLDLKSNYEKRTHNVLKLPCWSNAESYTPENSIQHLSTRGFTFPNHEGMEFISGMLDVPTIAPGKERRMTLVCSEIAVGRSKIIDSIPPSGDLPALYDSYYVTGNLLDRDNDNQFSMKEYKDAASFDQRNPKEYRHRYYLKDTLLVLPQYIVQVVVAPYSLANAIPTHPTAPLNANYDYYDTITFHPLTRAEREKSEESERRIVPIDEAYNRAGVEVGHRDPLILGKLQWLESQLDKTEETVRNVNLNFAEISEALREAYEKAVSDLNSLVRKKLEAVLSVEIELRRQKEQIDWVDLYMQRQHQSVDSVLSGKNGQFTYNDRKSAKLEYLRMWKCHTALRTSLGRVKDSKMHWRALNRVKPDIRARIDMEVFCSSSPRGGSDDGAFDTFSSSGSPVRSPLRGSRGEGTLLGAFNSPTGSPVRSSLRSTYQESLSSPGDASQAWDEMSGVHELGADLGTEDDSVDDIHRYLSTAGEQGVFAVTAKPTPLQDLATSTESIILHKFLDAQRIKIQAILSEKCESSALFRQKKGGVSNPESEQQADLLPLPYTIYNNLGQPFGDNYSVNGLFNLAVPQTHPASVHTARRREYADPKALFQDTVRAIVDPSPAQAQPDDPADDLESIVLSKSIRSEVSDAGNPSRQKADLKVSIPSKSVVALVDKQLSSSDLNRSLPLPVGRGKAKQDTATPQPRMNSTWSPVKSAPTGGSPMKTPKSPGLVSGQISHTVSVNAKKTAPRADPETQSQRSGSILGQRSTSGKIPELSAFLKNQRGEDEGSLLGGGFDDEPAEPPVEVITLPLPTLVKVASQYHPQLSLKEICSRKRSQMAARNITGYEASLEALYKSNILARTEAESLYFSLPFLSKPPLVTLTYSTAKHNRSLQEMYMKTLQTRGPSLLVVRSEDFVFGAYLSHPLHLTGGWSGGPACYLFSLTLDLKIGYHARHLPEESGGENVAFVVERDLLTIGDGDLVLGFALNEGESDLEHCFGIGLTPDSPEAATLLAGSSSFAIDDVEVWSIGN